MHESLQCQARAEITGDYIDDADHEETPSTFCTTYHAMRVWLGASSQCTNPPILSRMLQRNAGHAFFILLSHLHPDVERRLKELIILRIPCRWLFFVVSICSLTQYDVIHLRSMLILAIRTRLPAALSVAKRVTFLIPQWFPVLTFIFSILVSILLEICHCETTSWCSQRSRSVDKKFLWPRWLPLRWTEM